jgi:hypothetical protein
MAVHAASGPLALSVCDPVKVWSAGRRSRNIIGFRAERAICAAKAVQSIIASLNTEQADDRGVFRAVPSGGRRGPWGGSR